MPAPPHPRARPPRLATRHRKPRRRNARRALLGALAGVLASGLLAGQADPGAIAARPSIRPVAAVATGPPATTAHAPTTATATATAGPPATSPAPTGPPAPTGSPAPAGPPATAPVTPPSAGAACRRLRARFGHLRLGPRRKHLTILATGDSMIYPIDEELETGNPRGVRVIPERHDGTGLTTDTVDWRTLARRQVARFHPDAVVITLGGRDGGIPLQGTSHHLAECCGTAWLKLYSALQRPLLEAYLRGGRAHVYWLLIPAPRETLRAPLYEAVNEAVRLLATTSGPGLSVIRVDAAISPEGVFQEQISYEGLDLRPRARDGIHLSHEGACVEHSLLTEAMIHDELFTASGETSAGAPGG